jgi:DNA-binding transcriptional LysR family regulator
MGALSRWDETGFYWRAIPFGLSAEGVASNAPPGFTAHFRRHADLSRLRHSIGDELFIPSESGMQPTRRALDLASAVREGSEKLELALIGKESLPVEAFRTFRIAACDCACMVILPSLVKRLAKSAPHVDLRVFPSNRLDVFRHP